MVLVCCNYCVVISSEVDFLVEIDVGFEVFMGLICFKVGIVQKLVFNMIFMVIMVGLGKIYGNFMVDVFLSNEKLWQWVMFIVMVVMGCFCDDVIMVLYEVGGYVKMVIVMVLLGMIVI